MRAQHPLRGVRIVRVIEAPAAIVTVQEISTRLRLDLSFDSPVSDEDQETMDDVEAMIEAATGMLDGPSGRLGRALGPQTLELSVQGCGQTYIELPYPPFLEVLSVIQVGDDGEHVEVDAATWSVRRGAVYLAAGAPSVPELLIRYRAGYVDGESPPGEAVPKPLRQAVKLLVGDMWEFREAATLGQASEIPFTPTVKALTEPFRIYAI